MATFTFFDEFAANLGNKIIDLDSDVFKWALTNTAPVADTGATLSNITQITAANGYAAGGNTMSTPTWAETGAGTGIWRFSGADTVFTASGGPIGPFRYVVLYDDTPTSPADPLVGFLDYGSNIAVSDGNTFTVDVGASGIFTMTVP